MDTTLHIPWTNEVLEKLLLEVVKTGESTKVDFKKTLDLSSPSQKAELSRDIQAMANSSDHAYRNHGFLIIGAEPGKLTGTSFTQNADQMQATIDQIVREHIGPFVPTQVRHFEGDGKVWGVVVVPPSRNAPHVFVRDSGKYSRGDIWIRIGTTTSKAAPEDFARFYRVHLEDHSRELREEISDLRRDLDRIAKSRSAYKSKPSKAQPIIAPAVPTVPPEPEASRGLIETVRLNLKKAVDPVSSGLEEEALALRAFLDSNAIPWDLNNITQDSGRRVVQEIEDRAETFWKALAHVVENDEEGKYDAAILDALGILAFDPAAPAGTTFTACGTGVRLVPLAMALYIVFTIGVRKHREGLMSKIIQVQLTPRSTYEEQTVPIGTALFYVRRASEVFQALRDDYPNRRWCDSVGSYAQRWISSHLYSDFPKMAREPQMFYVGEFLLSLVAASARNIDQPSSGLFYFMSESVPPIKRFLRDEAPVLSKLFGKNLRRVLETFDEWGPKIGSSGHCWGDGFQRGAVQLVFPEPNEDKK